MDRRNEFNKYKIDSIESRKGTLGAYFDSITIEKIRFMLFDFETKKNINCYLSFDEVTMLLLKMKMGRLFGDAKNVNVHFGGNTTGNEGKPLARVMSLGKWNDKVIINMSESEGTLTETNAIAFNKDKVLNSLNISSDPFRFMALLERVSSYISNYEAMYLRKALTELGKEKGSK